MKQRRKVKSLLSHKRYGSNFLLTALLLILSVMLCIGSVSLMTMRVFAADNQIRSITYEGLDDNTEVVYNVDFINSNNLKETINKMEVIGKTLYVGPNPVIVNVKDAMNTIYEVYANILGGFGNVVKTKNVTLIGGSGNKVHGGNVNASVIGGEGNQVFEKWPNGTPAVMVGGRGNIIRTGHNGVGIIGGEKNEIGENVSDSFILGGSGNKIERNDSKNVIIGGKNVKVDKNTDNIFAYSNYDSDFNPETPNAFYLNMKNGVGINTESRETGISVGGAVSLGEIDPSITCDSDNYGVQGVHNGCVIGCTVAGKNAGGKWEMLDRGEKCKETCKNNKDSRCAYTGYDLTYADYVGYCLTGNIKTENMHMCETGAEKNYKNVVFEASIIAATGNCNGYPHNICLFQCDTGYELTGVYEGGRMVYKCATSKCRGGCADGWVESGTEITCYKKDKVQCNRGEKCEGETRICKDGKWYKNGSQSDWPSDYNFTGCKTEDNGCIVSNGTGCESKRFKINYYCKEGNDTPIIGTGRYGHSSDYLEKGRCYDDVNDDSKDGFSLVRRKYTTPNGVVITGRSTPTQIQDQCNDVNVYGVWEEANRCSITFYENTTDDVYDMPPVNPITGQCDRRAKDDKPERNPTRSGYIFSGWYKQLYNYTFESEPYDWENSKVSTPLVLYAFWKPAGNNTQPPQNDCRIDFDLNANGDSTTPTSIAPITKQCGQKFNSPTPDPKRESSDNCIKSYTFTGWYDKKDDGSKYNWDSDVTGNKTLYAHWDKEGNKIKITYVCEPGDTPYSYYVNPLGNLSGLKFNSSFCNNPIGWRIDGEDRLFNKDDTIPLSILKASCGGEIRIRPEYDTELEPLDEPEPGSPCSNGAYLEMGGWVNAKMETVSNNFRHLKRSTSPKPVGITNYFNISKNGCPVIIRGDGDTVYYYTEASKIYLNEDSSYMFGSSRVETIDMSGWDTSKVTSMHMMFGSGKNLKSLDLSSWDVSNVQDMHGMFVFCENLEKLDLSSWDVSNVKDMQAMFMDCSNLKEINLSGWNTSSLEEMDHMFAGCPKLKTIYATSDFNLKECKSSFGNPCGDGAFLENNSLVGGNGTRWSVLSRGGNHHATYARIDKPGQKGYFTALPQ